MAIVRWDPARELASMEIDRLNQMFSDFYGEAFSRRPGCRRSTSTRPTQHEVVLKAELPEMKREDISVTFENGVLTLKGERKFEQETKQENFQRRRAPARRVLAFVHAAEHGGRHAHQRRLQGWRADHPAAAARRGEAEADRRQRRLSASTGSTVRAAGPASPGPVLLYGRPPPRPAE